MSLIDYDALLHEQFAQLEASLDYLSEDQKNLVKKAFLVGKKAHSAQKRSSGEPYITHPLAVAQFLAQMHLDADTLCAAILHDVLEDTVYPKETLIAEFNTDIAELVDGVSKLTQIEFTSKAEAQAENYRKMLLAMTRDIRVIIIKLADRLHNMRTLESLSAAKKQRISRETLEIYAPIANRLGMHTIRIALEDLAFAGYFPLRSRILQKAVQEARDLRSEILDAIRLKVIERITDDHIDLVAVHGRQKHIYSIYQKMYKKHLSFGEIMDIYGLRIIVKTISDCYRALGAVHNLFKPVPGKFKDYIAIPKINGYQSLHTILFGPEGMPIEIQIRTEEMDSYAENGIAAHWIYKTDEKQIDLAEVKINNWLKSLIEMQQNSGSSQEFIESVKIDLFPDEVYVFTPKGKILELPGGATPIDFAYAVHTDIGNHCAGVRINRRAAPLSSILLNGQTVEVITDDEAYPKEEWLRFVVTGRARSGIKHYLKEKKYDVSIKLGKQLLLNALLSLGEANPNLNKHREQQLLKLYLYASIEELLSAIGLGELAPIEVAQSLLGHDIVPQSAQVTPLVIKGTEGMVVKFAPCCHPIPGDEICGLLIPNEGLWVHREPCTHVTHKAKNIIPLYWYPEIQGDFKASVLVDMENKKGVLASLTAGVANAKVNIQDIRVISDDGVFSTVQMLVLIKNTQVLDHMLQKLQHVPGVMRIERTPVVKLQ